MALTLGRTQARYLAGCPTLLVLVSRHRHSGLRVICLLYLLCSSVPRTSSRLWGRCWRLALMSLVSASLTWHVASLGIPVPSSWWSDRLAEMLTARCLYAELTHPLAGSQACMEWHIGRCEHSVSRQLVTQRWRWPDSVATLCLQSGAFLSLLHSAAGDIPQERLLCLSPSSSFLGKLSRLSQLSSVKFNLSSWKWGELVRQSTGCSLYLFMQIYMCLCKCICTRCPVDARGQLCLVRGTGTWCLVSITPMDEQWLSAQNLSRSYSKSVCLYLWCLCTCMLQHAFGGHRYDFMRQFSPSGLFARQTLSWFCFPVYSEWGSHEFLSNSLVSTSSFALGVMGLRMHDTASGLVCGSRGLNLGHRPCVAGVFTSWASVRPSSTFFF